MGTVLEAVGSVGLGTADAADVGVLSELFVGDCQGFDEVHQKIEGFLDV